MLTCLHTHRRWACGTCAAQSAAAAGPFTTSRAAPPTGPLQAPACPALTPSCGIHLDLPPVGVSLSLKVSSQMVTHCLRGGAGRGGRGLLAARDTPDAFVWRERRVGPGLGFLLQPSRGRGGSSLPLLRSCRAGGEEDQGQARQGAGQPSPGGGHGKVLPSLCLPRNGPRCVQGQQVSAVSSLLHEGPGAERAEHRVWGPPKPPNSREKHMGAATRTEDPGKAGPAGCRAAQGRRLGRRRPISTPVPIQSRSRVPFAIHKL